MTVVAVMRENLPHNFMGKLQFSPFVKDFVK
jgi:hypothetical protein